MQFSILGVIWSCRLKCLDRQEKDYEAKRIYERVNYDLEMIKELGYCSGIENYSRYFDGREPGSRPFCLLDYFPKDKPIQRDLLHISLSLIRSYNCNQSYMYSYPIISRR